MFERNSQLIISEQEDRAKDDMHTCLFIISEQEDSRAYSFFLPLLSPSKLTNALPFHHLGITCDVAQQAIGVNPAPGR